MNPFSPNLSLFFCRITFLVTYFLFIFLFCYTLSVKQVPETNWELRGVIRVHLSLGGIAKKESSSLIFATFFYLGFYRITLLVGCLLHLISAPLTFPCQFPSFLVFCCCLVGWSVWSFGFFFYVCWDILFYAFHLTFSSWGNSDQLAGNDCAAWQVLMEKRAITWNIKQPRRISLLQGRSGTWFYLLGSRMLWALGEKGHWSTGGGQHTRGWAVLLRSLDSIFLFIQEIFLGS